MKQRNLFTMNLSLFETLCDQESLREAFLEVKRNKGAHGVDGKSIKDFEANLDEELAQLKKELESWSYKPMPVRRVEIPKPDGLGTRKLGVPAVRDRTVQTLIKQILEPILEPMFSENSYGFRPGRSQKHAIDAALEIVKTGKEHTVDIDLASFFDKVPHDRLIARLSKVIEDKRILRIIGLTLRSGVMVDGVVEPTEEGTTQGSPLSPILSNFVLDELDKELERRGLAFCRWADDCNIFVKTPKAAERIMASISKFIETRLKLKINRDKSKCAPTSKVKFLGMTIVNKTVAISKKALDRAMDKVKELTPRGTHLPIEKSIGRINSWYIGWANYFKMTQYPAQLEKIEAHIRRRLRSRFIGQQKRRRHLANKLIGMGVKRGTVNKQVYSNKGRWTLSHTSAVEKAWTNGWFAKRGLKIVSDQKMEHWFGIKQWIKLT
jgi:group II intron reverse transcriptase/maturase